MTSGAKSITIRYPDDFHVHFRDGHMLRIIAPFTARNFNRALIMPNLQPPIRTVSDAAAYRQRILEAAGNFPNFTPLMTLYLTDVTSADDIRAAKASGFIHACKLYPAGATTNSAQGVTKLSLVVPALREMESVGLVLCIHGESGRRDADIFEKESIFVATVLPVLLRNFPRLKIVLEHITTSEAANFVLEANNDRLSATITAHHLLYSRAALFANSKIHPHMFCLPILKHESHRRALLSAISRDTYGRFFAGTDSAPHEVDQKLCADGCAGIFTACCAVELYAEAFEKADILHKLEDFLSVNGATFYGLKLNQQKVTLIRKPESVPYAFFVPNVGDIVPLRAGESTLWSVAP